MTHPVEEPSAERREDERDAEDSAAEHDPSDLERYRLNPKLARSSWLQPYVQRAA